MEVALPPRGDSSMNMTSPRLILRAAAVVVFILATLGIAPVPMTPLGLACMSGWPSTGSREGKVNERIHGGTAGGAA
jgi:hypothetical protein